VSCPSFVSELRSVRIYGKIFDDTQQKSVDGRNQLSDILLFDILRVEQMSLLELSLHFCDGNKLVRMMAWMIYILKFKSVGFNVKNRS